MKDVLPQLHHQPVERRLDVKVWKPNWLRRTFSTAARD
jgi:hypothetical protein